MIELTINGEPHRMAEGTTIGSLLDERGIERRGIAVARNRTVVLKSAWDAEVLRSGDRVEIVTAAAGG